jgi:hypothetical protein
MSTFLSGAYSCGIFENPSIPSLFLNWNIQWAFPLKKHSNDGVRFDYCPRLTMRRYKLLGMFQVHLFKTELPEILRDGRLTEVILNLLATGWYALMYVDYFHLPGTGQHLRQHFRYGFLIFDHDVEAKEFKGALYAKGQRFGAVTVPYDRLLEAVVSPVGRGKKYAGFGHGNSLIGIQPASGADIFGKLNLSEIRMQLTHYLNSSMLPSDLISTPLIRSFCLADKGRTSNAVFGINVYDQLREYFNERSKSEFAGYDARTTRLLWEHKKLMKVRLLRMAQEGTPLDSGFLSQWDEIEELAHWIHLKAVAAKQQNDSKLLTSLNGYFDWLKSLEADFIRRLIRKMAP